MKPDQAHCLIDRSSGLPTSHVLVIMLKSIAPPRFLLLALLAFGAVWTPVIPFIDPVAVQAATPTATQAEQLLEKATTLASQNQHEQAVKTAQQALTIYRQLNDKRGEGIALKALAAITLNAGLYGQSIQFATAALRIGYQLDDISIMADVLPLLGQALGNNGDYGSALEIYQQYSAFLQQLKGQIPADQPDLVKQVYAEQGSTLNTLGVIYGVLGQYDRAIEYYQQGLKIAREVGDRGEEAESLFRLSVAYGMKEDRNRAISYLNQVDAIVKEVDSEQAKAAVYSLRGAIAFYLDDNPTEAMNYYRQTLEIAQKLNDSELLQDALQNGGSILTVQGKYPEAIAALALAVKLADSTANNSSAVDLANSLAVALFRSGKLAEAQQVLEASMNAAEAIRTTLQSNNTTATDISRDINKVSLFDTQAQTYDLFQRLLIAQNQPGKALEIAERGRARAFVELLGSRVQGQNLQARADAAAIKPVQLNEIQQIAKAQQATLVQYSIIYDDLKGRGKPKAQEADLFIWVVKPTGEIRFKQVNLKQALGRTSIANLVTVSRESIGVRGLTFQEDAQLINRILQTESTTNDQLRQLHRLLIEPIADLLPKNPTERVIFIPQGPLFAVPFPALQDQNNTYLIDQHTIAIAPAVQVLALTAQQRQKVQRAGLKDTLVIGNPLMPRLAPRPGEPARQLASLPGAEQEAKAIAQILNTQPLLGKQATKSAILQRMPQARIIHLATHGLLEDFSGSGVPGAIALAPDGQASAQRSTGLQGLDQVLAPPDGFLTTLELLNLKLNAELVVLSACDTGGGKITGDGVIGLSRSFIIAGVPSVVVSLWQVPDEPTAALMTNFYKNLKQKQDKATALRQAMLATRELYPDPRAWAAFTLIGEAD